MPDLQGILKQIDEIQAQLEAVNDLLKGKDTDDEITEPSA